MSHPSFVLRRGPVLLPRSFEIAYFLSHSVWSALLSMSNASGRITRKLAENQEHITLDHVLQVDERDYWEPLVFEWVAWCVGGELDFIDAASTFVHAMFLRYGVTVGSNVAAVDLLVMRYLRDREDKLWNNLEPPTKLGLFRDTLAMTYDACERLASGVDSTPTRLDTEDLDIVDLDRVDDGADVPPPSHNKRWNFIIGDRSFLAICAEWKSNIRRFFCGENSDMFNTDNPTDITPQVDILLPLRATALSAVSQMRAVPKDVYNSRAWRDAVTNSGLASTMLEIATPGVVYQLSAPIMDTRNIGLWQDTLGELIHKWTPDTAFDRRVPAPLPPLHSPQCTPGGKSFINKLNKHPTIIPHVGNCFALFFLHDSQAFTSAWDDWLLPGLLARGHLGARLWHPETLFRNIKSYISNPQTTLSHLHPTLRRILLHTVHNNTLIKKYRQWLFHQHNLYHPPSDLQQSLASSGSMLEEHSPPHRSSISSPHASTPSVTPESQNIPSAPKHPSISAGVCPKCRHLKEEDTCIRRVNVQRHHNADNLSGAIFTLATSMFHTRSSDAPASQSQGSVKYVSPEDSELGFFRITHRSDVFNRCGRDVTVFIDEDTDENIGGVIYKAFSNEILNSMKASHKRVTKNTSIKRGNKFQTCATGKMVPIGARIPRGGAVGDGYAAYAHMSAATNDAIDCLMAHGLDGDLLLTAVEPFNKHIRPSLEQATDYADKDVSVSLCSQLEKTGCQDGEWDFVYASHGVYIETLENTVWWFNSKNLHGSVVPSRMILRSQTNTSSERTASSHRQSLRQQATRQSRTSTDPGAQAKLVGRIGMDVPEWLQQYAKGRYIGFLAQPAEACTPER
ncbi:hypothetical protein BDY19DRAFT_998326 [Irpex rosettiformis]|uniref:Uncharacterized protein n=1 Tax=Irpex rosettiformis TaxID=378272 RepID=A0ACB8TP42_9APHY|nr:hypothetical protein BDY19DRAFT_998326 [Irpex rosettiformis]